MWAKDTLPSDVELGRLNVARSPAPVLAQSLTEALTNLSNDSTLYTTLTYEQVVQAIESGKLPDGSDIYRVDSPLENLALYKELLTTGKITLPDGTVLSSPMTNLELAAIFFGGAADKTIDVSTGTVEAVDTILEIKTLTPQQEADLALMADKVRAAILTEHGE